MTNPPAGGSLSVVTDGAPSDVEVVARVLGQADPLVPAFVDLFPTMQHKPYNSPHPGKLGHRSLPAIPQGEEDLVFISKFG